MKQIKGFITRDDIITPSNQTTATIYELSDISQTYSKYKHVYYSSENPFYALHVFKLHNASELTSIEISRILDVNVKFNTFLSSNFTTNKQQSIILFLNEYNLSNPSYQVTNLNYGTVAEYSNLKAADFITFTVAGVECSIWNSDNSFKVFYPEYDISIVLPFPDFFNIINNPGDFINRINNFNIIEFNTRIENDKAQYPTTFTKIINIPYKIPNTSVIKDCYFTFNIYGQQGNFDHVLKLALYNYLVNESGLNGNFIESIFPNILNINEFFIVPRWDKVAISNQVGQTGVSSQITPTYVEQFDSDKFIKVYSNELYLKNNTYNVPFDYNNILLQITNGFYTESNIKDFKGYYSDFITVTSTHPDFSRMSQRTQKFVTLLETMINIADSNSQTELFNKIIQNTTYKFSIISRSNVNYLSILYEKHQLYVIPKYQFHSNL